MHVVLALQGKVKSNKIKIRTVSSATTNAAPEQDVTPEKPSPAESSASYCKHNIGLPFC